MVEFIYFKPKALLMNMPEMAIFCDLGRERWTMYNAAQAQIVELSAFVCGESAGCLIERRLMRNCDVWNLGTDGTVELLDNKCSCWTQWHLQQISECRPAHCE